MTRPDWDVRFWKKVNKTDECWLWTSHCDGGGYGRFWLLGVSRLAHVVIWEATHGPVPDGLEVLHSCDIRNCVRVDHLSVGSHLKNMRESAERNRVARRSLTPEQAIEIRKRHPAETVTALALEYGVSFWTMRDVIRRRTFDWIQEDK